MSDRNCSCNGSFVAFLLGIAAGVGAVTFLNSPKGKELKTQVKDWAEDNIEDGLEKLEALKEDVEKEIKKKKKMLEKKVQKIKEDLIDEEK